jgi:hypothetical protein
MTRPWFALFMTLPGCGLAIDDVGKSVAGNEGRRATGIQPTAALSI